tara:strand:+ start:1000 stop:1272 length:273 start_codon:yes stop_codon:yes gene_type:complete
MEKFIKLAVTGLGIETLSLSNVKMIIGNGTTSTVVHYLGGAKATLTTVTDASFLLESQLQNSMVSLYQNSWTNNQDTITPVVAVSAIAVS